jgi:hypothetical protein
MNEHTHYEELAALAAGGHLCAEEMKDLQRHLETCAECKNVTAEFRDIVHFGLPLTSSRFRRRIDMILARPDPGARERFIRRASLEGITFSPDVKGTDSSRGRHLGFAGAGVGVLAAIVAALFVSHHLGQPFGQFDRRDSTRALQQVAPRTPQNSASEVTIQTISEQHREIEDLRAQVATLTAAANKSQHNADPTQAAPTQSASQNSLSLEEIEAQRGIQEKLLSDTRAELTRLNKEHASDQASLVAQQIHINELSEQLKTAKTNISNMQRQLVTASGDSRNLMGARQLHVVDVRDTDPNGKPGKAFGRVFLTEGKSLVFYAFDLNNLSKNDAKKSFQVWGQQTGKPGSLRSLGLLNVDNKMQQRWALKTSDAAAFKNINSIFVTVEPQGGAKSPSGQRLLFAYLGEANHP